MRQPKPIRVMYLSQCQLCEILFLMLLSHPTQGQDSSDLVDFTAVPLLSSADSCVQSAFGYEYGSQLVEQSCDAFAPFSCFCKDTAHYSTYIYQLHLLASQECSGESSGNTAVDIFRQYCSLNA